MFQHILPGGLAVLAAAAMAPSCMSPALAQTSSRNDVMCLVRAGKAGNEPLNIVVPSRDAAALKVKGFELADCRGTPFSRAAQIALRDRVCRIAADEPEGIQLQFEHILGERPAVLCGLAEAAQGVWSSEERGQ